MEDQKTSRRFFSVWNKLLQLAPTHPSVLKQNEAPAPLKGGLVRLTQLVEHVEPAPKARVAPIVGEGKDFRPNKSRRR